MTDTPFHRGRRLRATPALRELFAETRLAPADLIQPLFIAEDPNELGPIEAMPGVERVSAQGAVESASRAHSAGVPAVILFGVPSEKHADGRSAWNPDGPTPKAIRALREHIPDIAVIADVCLCQYTDHGHCGLIDAQGVIDNDATLPLLAKAALTYAEAGAHAVAPSANADGMVHAIRQTLDANQHAEASILSYAVKHASALYGPFRDAAHSAPAMGDRRAYQMDPRNGREAFAEADADTREGADAIIVKPATASLDIIARLRDRRPEARLIAYRVSGEYAMLEAAGARGWIDADAARLESLHAIKRAGADAIITYDATRVAEGLR